MPVFLTREAILAADDLPTEEVEVPEWGGVVRVRAMSAAERSAYFISIVGPKGDQEPNLQNIQARLVVRCLVDEKGERLFRDEDEEILGRKSARALQRLFEAAQRLSAISPGDIEELTKNSLPTQSEGSPSS